MDITKASAEQLEQHVRKLTVDIGVRLAGSAAEREAANYLAKTGAFLPGVSATIEDFPVWERAVEHESLEVEINGQWQTFACSLFGLSPTTEGRVIEAPLVFFDAQTGYQREDLSGLKGAAAVHLGCHIETAAYYQRLIEAEPAFLLFVDTRHPGAVALADGLFPAYVHAYGARTTVNVAYQDAWSWRTKRATAARLCVSGSRRKSQSENVILEIPGQDPEAGVIYVGGHHDTQAGTVGADDNAIGSAAVVELARILSGRKLKRTLRFISFGTEEQLSVGSATYVRRHRDEIARHGRFMFNIDGSGSALGWLAMTYNGSSADEALLRDVFKQHDLYFTLTRDLCPYTDQFPFAAAGVPGLWMTRHNCTSGAFYHHRSDNTIDKLDFELAARQLDAVAAFLIKLAEEDSTGNPATEGISATEQVEIKRIWETIYGGWTGF